jgi:hypothetical protein
MTSCGSVKRAFDDAGISDVQADASGEIPPPPLLTPSRDIVNGVGRLKSATFTLDVEVGPTVSQRPATGPTYKLEGHIAVDPDR